MSKRLRIGLLQMLSHEADMDYNLAKGLEYCRQAKEQGCHIALFPEMWNVGYYEIERADVEAQVERFKSWSIPSNSAFVMAFRSLAKELDMIIAVTYLEAEATAEPPQGVMIIIDGTGTIKLKYAKVHTCDFDIGAVYKPGDEFPVAEVQTAVGAVKLGAMLCYDREFPEAARILMLNGCELILTANCCVLDDKRIHQFQARAFENALAVVMANYPDPQTNGRSCAFDGSGNLLMEAGEEETLCIAELDLEELRAYRSTCGWGNAFRRPGKYYLLTSADVQPPFKRMNGLGKEFDPKVR